MELALRTKGLLHVAWCQCTDIGGIVVPCKLGAVKAIMLCTWIFRAEIWPEWEQHRGGLSCCLALICTFCLPSFHEPAGSLTDDRTRILHPRRLCYIIYEKANTSFCKQSRHRLCLLIFHCCLLLSTHGWAPRKRRDLFLVKDLELIKPLKGKTWKNFGSSLFTNTLGHTEPFSGVGGTIHIPLTLG